MTIMDIIIITLFGAFVVNNIFLFFVATDLKVIDILGCFDGIIMILAFLIGYFY